MYSLWKPSLRCHHQQIGGLTGRTSDRELVNVGHCISMISRATAARFRIDVTEALDLDHDTEYFWTS